MYTATDRTTRHLTIKLLGQKVNNDTLKPLFVCPSSGSRSTAIDVFENPGSLRTRMVMATASHLWCVI